MMERYTLSQASWGILALPYIEHLPAMECVTICLFPSRLFDDKGHGFFFLSIGVLPAAIKPETQGIINEYQTMFLEQRLIILAG